MKLHVQLAARETRKILNQFSKSKCFSAIAIFWGIVTLWQWLNSSLVPWHSTKSNNVRRRPQHPVQHTSSLCSSGAAADRSTRPDFKLTVIFDDADAPFLEKHSSGWVCVVHWGVCVLRVHATGRQGRRPSGENLGHLWSRREFRAGAGRWGQHLPLLTPPSPLTPLPPDSRHSSTLQGLGRFEQPSWIGMRREKCRNLVSWR